MFERFSERARQVVVLAQDEARSLKHNYIGTEHLLLGLFREEEGIAARALESLGITLGEVRAQVARLVGEGDEIAGGQIPFTPRAKKVLELSMREALSLGHNYIGTEHILLGVARENEASRRASCWTSASTTRRFATRCSPRWADPRRFQSRAPSLAAGGATAEAAACGRRRLSLSAGRCSASPPGSGCCSAG